MRDMSEDKMFGVLWPAIVVFIKALVITILVSMITSCSSDNDPLPSQEQLLINKWWKLQTETKNTVPQPPIDLQVYFDENGWCTIREDTDFVYSWRLIDNMLDIGSSRFKMRAELTWMTLIYNIQDSTGLVITVLYFE